MRVLYLAHRLPYPPNKGDKIRSFQILSHLAARHEVHVLCPLDDATDMEHVPTLRALVAGLGYSRIDGLPAKLKRPLALLTGEPISLAAFRSTELQTRVDTLLDQHSFDAAFAYSSPMADYLFKSRHWHGSLRTIRKLMDLIDVDSAKWNDYAARSVGWRRWIYRREARLLATYEARVARDFDSLFLVSEAERRALPPAVPAAKVQALPNGVDLEYFTSTRQPDVKPQRVVFTGVMDYWPNVEGVTWFVRNVWPIVRARYPDAQLDVVGSKPVEGIRRLASEPGVTVTGFVPDVRVYVAAASLCIAPLRIARGVQNKVLEAMAMARPVVCTSQALEGICACPGKDLLLADAPDAFAAEISRLLDSPDEIVRVGTAARAFVEQHHHWSSTLAPLDAALS